MNPLRRQRLFAVLEHLPPEHTPVAPRVKDETRVDEKGGENL
jgi:hypothetical protein